LNPPLTFNAWLRYDLVRRVLRDLNEIKTVLEIGAGEGAVGVRLAQAFSYTGVEPDPLAFETARRRLERVPPAEIYLGDASAVPAARKFDLVCAFEVIEHIRDDKQACEQWRDLLRPYGWLLVSVPAYRRRFGPADVKVGHYRRYDLRDIRELLERSGFLPKKTLTYGFPLGYALEGARNLLARRDRVNWGLEARTLESGRWLQPPGWMGVVTRILSAPFRIAQRPFATTSLGTGLVVLAMRSE
jgi:SAM-dependent methyltransferase